MAKRYIDNVTIMADLNERVVLPTELVCLENSFNYTMAQVDKWVNGDGQTVTEAPTDKEGEFIFEATISGYAHKVYCAVVVGDIDHSPQSIFPEQIDQFGVPKQDIQTSDIPDIDDYQYFKAKLNRTTVENQLLKGLTEGLADKIIIARDVNHVRNAVIEIEKYCLKLKDKMDELESKMIISAENLGTGEGVYAGLADDGNSKKLQLKSLKAGNNINITSDANEITIASDGVTMNTCGNNEFVADSFRICKEDGHVKWADYMGIKYVETDNNNKSLLILFGQGDGADKNFINAGRIVKSTRNFMMEMKTIGGFSGIDIHGDTGKVEIYENDIASHIDARLGNTPSVYSPDIAMTKYPN